MAKFDYEKKGDMNHLKFTKGNRITVLKKVSNWKIIKEQNYRMLDSLADRKIMRNIFDFL